MEIGKIRRQFRSLQNEYEKWIVEMRPQHMFYNVANRRDGCTIIDVLEAKKDIPD